MREGGGGKWKRGDSFAAAAANDIEGKEKGAVVLVVGAAAAAAAAAQLNESRNGFSRVNHLGTMLCEKKDGESNHGLIIFLMKFRLWNVSHVCRSDHRNPLPELPVSSRWSLINIYALGIRK